MRIGNGRYGAFALPVVLISSLVMMLLLSVTLTGVTSSSVVLDDQRVTRLAAEASESGIAMAQACLRANNYIPQWSDANKLRPNTNCSGTIYGSGTASGKYIGTSGRYKVRFEVGNPTTVGSSQVLTVSAIVDSFRASNPNAPTPASSTVKTTRAVLSAQSSLSNIAFGYRYGGAGFADNGSQFIVILPNGDAMGVGENSNGRLGIGSLSDSLTPQKFSLGGVKAASAYTSFLSVGDTVHIVRTDGQLYSAGTNSSGQLGFAGNTSSPISNPLRFGLPGGVTASFVAPSFNSTFVIGNNFNIYAAGACTQGQLGTGGACTTTSSPTRVALPAVTTNTNTRPVLSAGGTQPTNLATDRYTSYVRMQGGYVYGWGDNNTGQLADGSAGNSYPTPKLMQAINSGVPTPYTPIASQVANNGEAVYVLDTAGTVWAAGSSVFGQQAGAGIQYRNAGNPNVCMQKDTTSSTSGYFKSPNCVPATSGVHGWQVQEFWPDGTWRFRIDSRTYDFPADSSSTRCATANGVSSGGTDPAGYIYLTTCPAAGAAVPSTLQWEYRADRTIRNIGRNACVEPYDNLYLYPCRSSGDGLYPYQVWTPQNNNVLKPIPRPPGNPVPIYTKITTDAYGVSLLDSNGKVWAAGSNNMGQLGIGTISHTPVLKQVSALNAYVVTDIYATEASPNYDPTYTGDETRYNNTYYVTSSGQVFGAGSNYWGQLGIGGSYPITPNYRATPQQMNLPAGASPKTVQAGYGTAVIVTNSGKVYTVGNNSNGQLGNGNTTPSSTPQLNIYTNMVPATIY